MCCQLILQFLNAVLLVKAPIENKQNTSKQVKFESSHVKIIHKPRTRDRGQYLSLLGSGQATQNPWPAGQISGQALAQPSPSTCVFRVNAVSI